MQVHKYMRSKQISSIGLARACTFHCRGHIDVTCVVRKRVHDAIDFFAEQLQPVCHLNIRIGRWRVITERSEGGARWSVASVAAMAWSWKRVTATIGE